MNSAWVKTEIANARDREDREKKQMLFPITLAPFEDIRQWKLFDADRGIDSAREIREYFIPDFSNWKDHDSYQQAFRQLVKDLKAERVPPAEAAPILWSGVNAGPSTSLRAGSKRPALPPLA
jgi:hypothetical protein